MEGSMNPLIRIAMTLELGLPLGGAGDARFIVPESACGDGPIHLWKWGSVRGAAGDARLIFPGAARGRERPVWAMEHSDK